VSDAGKVVKLVTDRCDVGCVEIARHILKKAEAGEIRSLAVACVEKVGVSTWLTPGAVSIDMLGNLDIMASRIRHDLIRGSVGVQVDKNLLEPKEPE